MPGRIDAPSVRTTTPTQTPPTSVTVKSGDSLGKIAQRMGVSTAALVQANSGRYPSLATNPNSIQVGWKLNAPGAAPTGNTTPSTPNRPAGWTQTGQTNQTNTAGRVGTEVRTNDLGNRFAAGGAQSLQMRMDAHNKAIDKTGVGTYYGDHSAWKTMTPADRQQWIKENAIAGTTPPTPKESSCIAWAMENVGAAYAAAGKSARWAEIQRIVSSQGLKGTDLAKELKKDGWEAVYWNPDAKNPEDGNPEHSFSASQVAKGKPYYGIEVDHKVQNYRPTEGKNTQLDMSGVEKLKQVPFFFGLAKGGMHTFVGREGKVNEFHWAEMPNSKNAIEERPLQNFPWNSGVIMVPPGTWPKS